ncbi:hypothetical protein ACJMK2_000286 [Sinanodonta woodiana]|uniref:Uncharacterized protein n=1 Tax=Sinanodonta woodiana TaxID=1069815 RepID=A0ABD3XR49_SINWO
MATASSPQEQLSHLLECTICLDKFKRPKVLPCGHTYCAACLQSHINSKLIQNGKRQTSFPCPVCRASTTPPDPTTDADKWAEFFPVNSMVASMLEFKVGKRCDLCVKRNKETQAVSYCRECKKSMCAICQEYHDDMSACNKGNILNLNSGNKSNDIPPNLAFIEICSKHLNERIQFFCKDHNTMCCSICGFLEHRKCETIVTLDEMIVSVDIFVKSKDVEINLKKCQSNLKQVTSAVTGNIDTLDKDKAAITKQLKQLEDDISSIMDAKKKEEDLNLQSQKAKVLSLITENETDLIQLDLVITHGSEVIKMIMLHKLNQNQERYCHTVSEFHKGCTGVKMTVIVDKTFQDMTHKLCTLGKINMTRTKLTLPPCRTPATSDSIDNDHCKPSTSQNDLKVKKLSGMFVNMAEDKYICYITDIVQLSDSVLFVDHGNSKIKIFSNNYKYRDCLFLDQSPWSACAMSDTEAAVSFPYQKTVYIVDVTDKVHISREIKTKLMCWGLAALRDKLVISTWKDQDCVLILDKKGTEIRRIYPDQNYGHQFLRPSLVTTNISKGITYVLYHPGNIIVAYDSSWKTLFVYTHQDIVGQGGLDTDKDGNIYVCGSRSRGIQQVSADGTFLKKVVPLDKQGKIPLRIRFCKNSRLFMTYSHCNVIDVYDMYG